MLDDDEGGQVEDIDVIPNEEVILVVHSWFLTGFSLSYLTCCGIFNLIDKYNPFTFQAISEKGYVKRMKPNTFVAQNRGTIGKSVGKMRVNDMMSDFLVCRAHDHILYFRYELYSSGNLMYYGSCLG